jgi:hypothetical protein
MSAGYRVSWEDGSISLQTREAAIHLAKAFHSEGRKAEVHEFSGNHWKEIEC